MNYIISGPSFYIISAEGRPIAQVISQEWAQQIVEGLMLLEAAKKSNIERLAEALDDWGRTENPLK